jgi:hypothetical protein
MPPKNGYHSCHRHGDSKPEQDINLNSCSLSRRGRLPGLGWRNQVGQVLVVDGSGRLKVQVESTTKPDFSPKMPDISPNLVLF